MPVGVYAELTADGEQIVMMATGDLPDVIQAAKLAETMTPLIKPTVPPGALIMPASWPAAVQLSATFGDGFMPGPALAEWLNAEAQRRLQALPAALTVPVPDGLIARPYQVAGALEIARTGRALIFDEPRTGKTITTILGLAEWAAVDEFQLDHRKLPIVVVCPASVVDPWVEEFRRWAPYWRTVAWRGDPARRRGLAGTADVYVTSYGTARMDVGTRYAKQDPLIELGARALVVDECHLIKNPQAAQTKAVLRLGRNAAAFVALSGTPITHHAGDLWSTLQLLAPGAWPSKERWVSRYMLSAPVDYGDGIVGFNPHRDAEYRLAVLGQHRRVARADVMADLPPKTYSTRVVDLPAEYRRAYDQMAADMLASLPDGQEMSVMDVLSQLQCLSALASAAADVEIEYGPDVDEKTGELKRHMHVKLKAPSWKVTALLEVLDERPGEQVAVFSPSRQLVELAGQAAQKAGYRVGYIVGGQSAKERTAARQAFQVGDLDVICCTTGAGGTGITLSAAGTLVFLSRPWSLVESLQAEDRGEGDLTQTRGTEIIDIIARNTVDDSKIRDTLRHKAGQLAELLQDPRIVTELLGGAAAAKALRTAS